MNRGECRDAAASRDLFRRLRPGELHPGGEQLNMAQPAVSLAIRELEVFYNVRLFERMNRRVYLTEAGRTLRQYADTVLSQFQESVEVLRESGAQGACRFGVHVTLGETRLAGILAHLAEALPEITVRGQYSQLQGDRADDPAERTGFCRSGQCHRLAPTTWWSPCAVRSWRPVCAPGYLEGKNSLTLAELAEERLLLRERGSGTRRSVDRVFEEHSLSPQPFFGKRQLHRPDRGGPGGAGSAHPLPSLAGGTGDRGPSAVEGPWLPVFPPVLLRPPQAKGPLPAFGGAAGSATGELRKISKGKEPRTRGSFRFRSLLLKE